MDMYPIPHDCDRRLVDGLLGEVAPVCDIAGRTVEISGRFLGSPYRVKPLIGSPDSPEVLTASLEGFDCVTYVETVLALARSHDTEAFVDNLRRMRYLNGAVDWGARNHYMTDWIRRNRRLGFISALTRGPGVVERKRRLNLVEGLAERRVRVRSIAKSAFVQRQEEFRRGDFAFFASTRTNLDVFHCGILVGGPGAFRLRHAARSRGRVVEEALEAFLGRNRMTGVILVRPREVYSKAA